MRNSIVFLPLVLALGCSKSEGPAPAGEPASPDKPPATEAAGVVGEVTSATVGQMAPDFELPSLDGGKVKLSDHRGKVVVLEWFNPECPFVRQSHSEGTLKGMGAKITAEGVVWLAINSNAPGKQGSAEEANRAGKESFGIGYPILLDREGVVGRAYKAKHTPHMYVIDKAGKLVYAGAIDSSKGGDVADTPDLVNYVSAALADLGAGRAVATPETEAWGCTVKYK